MPRYYFTFFGMSQHVNRISDYGVKVDDIYIGEVENGNCRINRVFVEFIALAPGFAVVRHL